MRCVTLTSIRRSVVVRQPMLQINYCRVVVVGTFAFDAAFNFGVVLVGLGVIGDIVVHFIVSQSVVQDFKLDLSLDL